VASKEVEMLRKTAAAAAAAGFALVIAIGAGSVPAGATAQAQKRPEKEAYVRQADTICRESMDRTDAIVEDLGFSPSDREARRAMRKVVRISRRELRELRALTPPKGDARDVAQIYDAVDTALDRIGGKPRRLFDEPGPFVRPARLAKAYGLDFCGRG
jgi:hypothetical protein